MRARSRFCRAPSVIAFAHVLQRVFALLLPLLERLRCVLIVRRVVRSRHAAFITLAFDVIATAGAVLLQRFGPGRFATARSGLRVTHLTPPCSLGLQTGARHVPVEGPTGADAVNR